MGGLGKRDRFHLGDALLFLQLEPVGHVSHCGHDHLCVAKADYLGENLNPLALALIALGVKGEVGAIE